METIDFRPLALTDLALLHQWFSIPHVKRWYAREKNYTLAMITDQYSPRIANPSQIPNYIITLDNHPIGYIQLYQVATSLPEGVNDYEHPLFTEFEPQDLAGIDLFIAEESLLHKGYASKTVRQFIDVVIREHFAAVVVDPRKDNTIAINFFKKLGFCEYGISSNTNQHALLILKLKNVHIAQ